MPERLTSRLIAAGYIGLLTAACLVPDTGAPDIPINGFDLWAHLLLFGAEAILIARAFAVAPGRIAQAHLSSAGLAFLHGGFIEILQPLISGGIRRFDWWDIAADGTGILLFSGGSYWLSLRARREEPRT